MNARLNRLGLAAALLLGHGALALAGQEVPVGRVDVQLPGEGWQVHVLPDTGNTYAGSGHTHQQETELKFIARVAPDGVIEALFVIRANASGKGRFSGVVYPNSNCTAGRGVFAEGDEPGPGLRSFRCLQMVQTPVDRLSSYLPAPAMTWILQNGWRFPPNVLAVSTQQHAHTGAFAVTLAFLRPLASKPADASAKNLPATLPIGLTATSVQWGRQLQEAVSDSVYSIRGKLPVPEMAFAEEALGAPTLPAEPPTSTPATPPRVPAPGAADRG